MTDHQHPAEPAVDDKGRPQGGFAEIARQLNLRFPPSHGQRPISRQLVYKWWQGRHSNAFPEAVAVKGSNNGGRGHPEFNYQGTIDWYVEYRKTRLRGAAPRMAKTPVSAPADKSLPRQNTHEERSLAA